MAKRIYLDPKDLGVSDLRVNELSKMIGAHDFTKGLPKALEFLMVEIADRAELVSIVFELAYILGCSNTERDYEDSKKN